MTRKFPTGTRQYELECKSRTVFEKNVVLRNRYLNCVADMLLASVAEYVDAYGVSRAETMIDRPVLPDQVASALRAAAVELRQRVASAPRLAVVSAVDPVDRGTGRLIQLGQELSRRLISAERRSWWSISSRSARFLRAIANSCHACRDDNATSRRTLTQCGGTVASQSLQSFDSTTCDSNHLSTSRPA